MTDDFTRAGDWIDKASCNAFDPSLWFPTVAATGDNRGIYDEARRICESCPVQAECGEYALRTRQHYGMWGGLTPWERRSHTKDTPVETLFERITCLGCARRRKEKFFPDPDLSVCRECLEDEVPVPATEPERARMGRPRKVPEDDELALWFATAASVSSLARKWGVTHSTVAFHKRRLQATGRVG